MNVAQKALRDELSRRATAANEKLGELRKKHHISDKHWNEIAEHHNAIIALAQEAISETGDRKPETGKKKGK